jgi:hypothetical protein
MLRIQGESPQFWQDIRSYSCRSGASDRKLDTGAARGLGSGKPNRMGTSSMALPLACITGPMSLILM